MTRSQKRIGLIVAVVIGAVVLLVGVAAGAYLSKQSQDTRNQAWGGRKTLPTPDWKHGGPYSPPEKPVRPRAEF